MNPPSPATPPVRLGLIGLGFGRHLARALAAIPSAQLIAVADRRVSPDRMTELCLPASVRLYPDARALIKNESIDGLLLATAPGGREPILSACAERGLPVFVEKPWAGNPDQARRYAHVCAPIADRVMLGFSFRFHPVVRRLRELIDGELGAVWLANGDYTFEWAIAPSSWLWDPQSGGGVFNENSCHLLDVLCHLAGTPVSVQASVNNPRRRPSAELAAVTLNFASGATAAVTLGACAAGAMDEFPRLDLITSGGRASLRGRGHVWQTLSWALRGSSSLQTFSSPPEYLGETRYSEALRRFILSIRDQTPPPASLADGLLAVDLADAILRSSSTGQSVAVPPSR